MKITENIEITNEDNMVLMARYPDNYFDLAIVDPPYGIGEGLKSRGMGTSAMSGNYKVKNWDKNTPNEKYFIELKRVSKNQIIWGANYMTKHLPPSMGWVFWDKDSSGDFSDGELAYTSFNRALRSVKVVWMGMRQYDMKNKEIRIHPTQKPVKLYEWLLMNYAKEGDKILDTHGGSMSIALAFHNVNSKNNMNLSLDLCELDKDYFDAGIKRYNNHIKQKNIFDL